MPFLDICRGDPLVDTLMGLFHANILRVPEERVRSLSVVASFEGKSSFRGTLAPLLKGNLPVDIPISISRMADLSGKSSRKVNLNLGVQILEGFLQGFSLPSA